MKTNILLALLLMAYSCLSFSAANCRHSHSWQCQQHHGSSGQTNPATVSTGTGSTPDTGSTNVHLGTSTTSVPMMTLQPATTHPASGNTQTPSAKPPIAPPLQPMAIPNPVPNKVPPKVPQKVPQAQPHLVPQPMAIPHPVPNKVPPKVPQKVPVAKPILVPQQISPPTVAVTPDNTGSIMPLKNSNQLHLVTNNPATATTHPLIYTKEAVFIGSTDYTASHHYDGFHLAMHGINVPQVRFDFIERPIAKPGDYVFFFDFDSSHLHEDQLPMLDAVVSNYGNRQSPLIVVGETDGFGSQAYNKALAHHRSSVIIQELIKRGVREDHIELRLLTRCCKDEPATERSVRATRGDRITWVHFE